MTEQSPSSPLDDNLGVCLKDANGRVRVLVSLSPAGSPYMHFNDEQGQPRMTFSLDADGSPHISLFAKDGFVAGSVGISETSGGGGVTFWSLNKQHFCNLCVDADGTVFQSG